MTEFTDIVCLGYRCRTTARLRAHFGFDTAYPFDWWITPVGGAVRFLRDWDVERLYDPAALQLIWKEGRAAFVEHRDYGMRLQHEFSRDEEGFVAPDWSEGIAAAKSRTTALMARFDALDREDRRILFVREARAVEGAGQLERLRAAIQERLPAADCQFLLISREGMAVPGWRSVLISDPTVRPWEGDPAIWDKALAGLGYRLVAGSEPVAAHASA